MNRAPRGAGVALAAAGAVAGCQWIAPAAPAAPSPEEACRAVADSLAAAVPPGQSLAELQARGIRVRTPLRFPPGTLPASAQPSGAAVQLLIQSDGSVLPGSPQTLKRIGEPQLATAMEAGALSMRFELDDGLRASPPIPYTAVMAVCPRS